MFRKILAMAAIGVAVLVSSSSAEAARPRWGFSVGPGGVSAGYGRGGWNRGYYNRGWNNNWNRGYYGNRGYYNYNRGYRYSPYNGYYGRHYNYGYVYPGYNYYY